MKFCVEKSKVHDDSKGRVHANEAYSLCRLLPSNANIIACNTKFCVFWHYLEHKTFGCVSHCMVTLRPKHAVVEKSLAMYVLLAGTNSDASTV